MKQEEALSAFAFEMRVGSEEAGYGEVVFSWSEVPRLRGSGHLAIRVELPYEVASSLLAKLSAPLPEAQEDSKWWAMGGYSIALRVIADGVEHAWRSSPPSVPSVYPAHLWHLIDVVGSYAPDAAAWFARSGIPRVGI